MTLDAEPIGKNDSTPDTESEPSNKPNTTHPPVSNVPAPVKSDGQKSPYHCEIACKKEKNWWDKTKPYVESVGVILLLIYTVYTVKMYYTNRDSADAAKSAANTADSTLKWTQQQFRNEQRPYLSPELRGGTQLKDGKIYMFVVDKVKGSATASLAVDLRNIGKSPAIRTLTTTTEFKVGPVEKVRKEVQDYAPTYSDKNTSSIVTMNAVITAQSDVQSFTKEEWGKLQDGTWEFYIVGGVRYEDIFNPTIAPYETTYCYQYWFKGLPLHNCPFKPPAFGNSIK